MHMRGDATYISSITSNSISGISDRISGVASVVQWLWSWRVIGKFSGDLMTSEASLYEVYVRWRINTRCLTIILESEAKEMNQFFPCFSHNHITPCLQLTLLNQRSEIATKAQGGAPRAHPLEINKGALWDPMLLKVILKHIKVMITCQRLYPYLKNSTRYWDLKILR